MDTVGIIFFVVAIINFITPWFNLWDVELKYKIKIGWSMGWLVSVIIYYLYLTK